MRGVQCLQLWFIDWNDLRPFLHSVSLLHSIRVLVLHFCQKLEPFILELLLSRCPHPHSLHIPLIRDSLVFLNSLLQQLTATPHAELRQLVLHTPHPDVYVRGDLPSEALFTRMLEVHRLLLVELRAPQRCRSSYDNANRAMMGLNYTRWDQIELRLRHLAEQLPQRFRFTA